MCRAMRTKGAQTANIVNVEGSSLDRLCDHSIYLFAGQEIGVASTKAYTMQVLCGELVSQVL